MDDMVKGWFVGNFEPRVCATNDVEVAVKRYIAGDHEEAHAHKIATEITVIITGEARMGEIHCKAGDIVVVYPGEATDFEAISDTTTTVVKLPSVRGDKYAI